MTGTDTRTVEERAREAIRDAIHVQFFMDEHEEYEATNRALAALTAAGLRLVEADADDRRAAELAAGRELVHALVQWDMCTGKGTCDEAFVRMTAERDAALDRMRGLEQAVDRRTAACESLAADVRSLVEFVETIDFEDQTGTLARSQGLWPIVERLRESEAGR